MFEKYINEVKSKEFLTSFIIVSILAMAAYSYMFLLPHSADDEGYLRDSIAKWVTLNGWSETMTIFARGLGYVWATLVSNGNEAKNFILALNIIITSFLAVFFVRCGLGVKSILWLILLASIICINTAIRVHYSYTINTIRCFPIVFMLCLVSSVFADRKVKNMIAVALVVFIGLAFYQISIFLFIMGVVALSIDYLIKNQNDDLSDILKSVISDKVIPAIVSLLVGLSAYSTMVHLIVVKKTDRMFNLNFDLVAFLGNLIEYTKHIAYFILFNTIPAGYNVMKVILVVLILATTFAIFFIFRKQKIQKLLFLSMMTIVTLLASWFVINAEQYLNQLAYTANRMFVANMTFLSFVFYLNYLAFREIKYLSTLYNILSLVFVIQIGNQVAVKGYDNVNANNEKNAIAQRVFNDVLSFARANKIQHKITVEFITKISDTRMQELHIDKKYQYLLFDATWGYLGQRYTHYNAFIENLGLKNDLKILPRNKTGMQKFIKGCKIITSDKTMARWPFYNSMKLIDGVIYVKMVDGLKPSLCKKYFTTYPLQTKKQMGYLDYTE